MPEEGKKKTKLAKPSGYTVARRSIWYLLRAAVIIVVIATLLVGVIITGIYCGNIYIVATEGLTLRAEYVLSGGSIYELEEYFTQQWLVSDPLINMRPYEGYSITNYDYRLYVEGVNVWPWSQSGTISFLERIPSISGTADNQSIPSELPKWTDVRCILTLNMIEGRWYITNIDVTEENPEYDAVQTPDMRLTPIPAATPTLAFEITAEPTSTALPTESSLLTDEP